jgi:hypothetical protein
MSSTFVTTVTIDPKLNNLLANLKRVDKVMRDEAWANVGATSDDMEQNIKEVMPKDTGRAAASWGRFDPSFLRAGASRTSKTKTGKRVRYQTAESQKGYTQVASASDAIWEENQAQMSIVQGTRVEYVPYLEDGHSTKAPAGFITAAEERAQIKTDQWSATLGQLIDDVLQGRGIKITKRGTKDKRTT